MIRLTLSLIVAAFLWSVVAPQAYAKPKWETAITRYLEHLKIAEDEVTNISVFSIKGPRPGADLGDRAWVSLKSCRGSLVINLTRFGRVTDTYTRADCRFEGVPRDVAATIAFDFFGQILSPAVGLAKLVIAKLFGVTTTSGAGQTANQGALSAYSSAPRCSIRPHDGVGSCNPKPR